jgi:hypothetical protein
MKRQTTLRNLRIHINQVPQRALFLFPFFDMALYVRFLLVMADTGPFVLYLHEKPRWERRSLVVSGRRPVPLADTQPDLFHRLFHFDPWWTMRGVSHVLPATRLAIIATNVAARRHSHLIIRDVIFGDGLQQVEEVRIGDGVFRTASHSQGRPMPWALQEAFFGEPATSSRGRGEAEGGYGAPRF